MEKRSMFHHHHYRSLPFTTGCPYDLFHGDYVAIGREEDAKYWIRDENPARTARRSRHDDAVGEEPRSRGAFYFIDSLDEAAQL